MDNGNKITLTLNKIFNWLVIVNKNQKGDFSNKVSFFDFCF